MTRTSVLSGTVPTYTGDRRDHECHCALRFIGRYGRVSLSIDALCRFARWQVPRAAAPMVAIGGSHGPECVAVPGRER